MNLKDNEERVGWDTRYLLQNMDIKIMPWTRDQAVNHLKEVLAIATYAIRNGYQASFLAFSGEGDPRVWNAVEEDFANAVNKGMNYNHCLGPVICTDDNGYSSIINLGLKKNEKVDIRLPRTRLIYHWWCLSLVNKDELRYVFHGEEHHESGETERRSFNFDFNNKDKMKPCMLYYWYERQQDYNSRLIIMDRITDLRPIPKATITQMQMAVSKARSKGLDFDLLSREEILSLIETC